MFPPRGDKLGRFRAEGELLHRGSLTLVGWSDAAYGKLSEDGRCRLGYIIGLMSSSLSGPCHVLQWTSKFTRKLVKSSLGGEVYAFSEMVDHMALIREFYTPFVGLSPGMVGLEDCESLFSHLRTKRMITEKYLVRHFLSIQQSLDNNELDNIYWLPGTENPADGMTKVRSEMPPMLRLLEFGEFYPGLLRPLKGVCSSEPCRE